MAAGISSAVDTSPSVLPATILTPIPPAVTLRNTADTWAPEGFEGSPPIPFADIAAHSSRRQGGDIEAQTLVSTSSSNGGWSYPLTQSRLERTDKNLFFSRIGQRARGLLCFLTYHPMTSRPS